MNIISKQQKKQQEKQQFEVKSQLTQEFADSMVPEQALEQTVQKQNTVDFEQLNFENFAEKTISELPVLEQNFDMLNMSKFAVEQKKEENASNNQIADVEKESKEMKSVEALKGLLSTIRDKKYGTSDDKGTWYIIQSSGEAFLENIENKSDRERGEQLAELLKSAQRYLGTHKGKRFTKKGRDRVDFAKNIVNSVSEILKSFTIEGRVLAVDAILEKQEQVSQPGEAEAKELNKEFFAEYAKSVLNIPKESETDNHDYITDKTFILMHAKERETCFKNSSKKITDGLMSKTLFVRTYSANAFGKNVILTREGDVRLEDAHDAKLTELAIKRAYNAGPEDATYVSRSAFLKLLEQIKITPDMLTREYMNSHYLEMKSLKNVVGLLDNCYKDWGSQKHGINKDVTEKELRSFPPAIQKKLDALYLFIDAIGKYQSYFELINCYTPGSDIALRDDVGKAIQNVKKSDILRKLDKIEDQNKKWDEIQSLVNFHKDGYGLDFMFGQVMVCPGESQVMDILEAKMFEIKQSYEKYKDNLEITDEDLKTIRYISYEQEAKKESERLGRDITPEAVAYSKMSKIEDIFIKQEAEKAENKALKEMLGDHNFTKMYVNKLRFVNYNKDGEPVTEEDKKNLEWNNAYAKSVLENNQEERVNLLKENYEYAAELINRVDFDRVLDFDYWLNNKDLYINLRNCCINGNIDLHSDSLFAEDRAAIKSFLGQYKIMAELLSDFFAAFHQMSVVHGEFGKTLGVDDDGEYMKDKVTGYENTSEKDIVEGIWGQEMKQRFDAVKNSNIKYIDSKKQINQIRGHR